MHENNKEKTCLLSDRLLQAIKKNWMAAGFVQPQNIFYPSFPKHI